MGWSPSFQDLAQRPAGFKVAAPAVELISERMREKLNSNPLAQLAVVGVLLVATGFFVLSSMGGRAEEEESAATEATVSVAGTTATGTATGATPGEAVEGAIEAATAGAAPVSVPPLPPSAASTAPPLPDEVTAAFEANRTVALLFVRNGGIDDRLVKVATAGLAAFPEVAVFIVPAEKIARYAAISQGVAVERVPALVVLRPKRLDRDGIPTASVSYGFQSPQSVAQAVIDAGYRGPTVDYHP